MATTGVTVKYYGSLQKPELSTQGMVVQCGKARFLGGNVAGRLVVSLDCKLASGSIKYIRAQYIKAGGKKNSGGMFLKSTATIKARKIHIRRATAGGHASTALSWFWYEIVGFEG